MKTAIAIAAAAILLTATVQGGQIIVKGSDTLIILAQKWAEIYMSNNAATRIQVSGGGSGIGIAALQTKTTDLCNASRPLSAEEIAGCVAAFDKRPTEYKVALDGLSVFVHPRNPISEMTLEQLAKVFTGKIQNWKDLGGQDAPITIYGRQRVSGTYEFFKENVLDNREFALGTQVMPDTISLLRAVAGDLNGIGYGGSAYGRGSKALRIRRTADSPAIEPSEANVIQGVYPIWRYLYVYVDPALDRNEIARYLNWIRGDQGQDIVKQVGYFALPKYLREN